MRRRPAITLIEVLVAIFIMAIGLLALLTLFPLGALRMATALQDGATPRPQTPEPTSATRSISVTIHSATHPLPFRDAAAEPILYHPAPPRQPSRRGHSCLRGSVGRGRQCTQRNCQCSWRTHVLCRAARAGHSGNLSGNLAGQPFGRENAGAVQQGLPVAARYFSLPDDMTFFTNGLPDTGTPPGSSSIQRAGRYTWAYLLKRPQPTNNSFVDLTVVVYAGRPPTVPLTRIHLRGRGPTE